MEAGFHGFVTDTEWLGRFLEVISKSDAIKGPMRFDTSRELRGPHMNQAVVILQ